MYLWDCFTHSKISLSPQFSSEKKKIPLTRHLSTLTYGAGSVAGVLLQKGDDLGLLSWWAAAADHSWTLTRQLHELVLVIPQTQLQTKQTYIISEVLQFLLLLEHRNKTTAISLKDVNSSIFVLADSNFLFSHCLFGHMLSILCCARKCVSVVLQYL